MYAEVGMMESRLEEQHGGFIVVGHRVLGPSVHSESEGFSVGKLGYAVLAGCPGLVGPASKVTIALDAMKFVPALLLENSSRLNVEAYTLPGESVAVLAVPDFLSAYLRFGIALISAEMWVVAHGSDPAPLEMFSRRGRLRERSVPATAAVRGRHCYQFACVDRA